MGKQKDKSITVTKASGERDVFKVDKLRRSLKHSGAGDEVIEHIVMDITSSLHDGITTQEIYKRAFALLRKNSRSTAARYKLKNAIMELGPSGYPFERFVAKILEHQGFRTKVGIIVQGHCVQHEVDVVAEKEDKHFMVECKHHSEQGGQCNVKIPLYIHSRFRDVEQQWKSHPGHETMFHQGWLYTNTRFTGDAIRYGNCAGLMLIGWDHPANGSMKEQIDISGLHPLTCLTTLTKDEKNTLLAGNKVLCMELCDQPGLLSPMGISETRQRAILKEAHELCGI